MQHQNDALSPKSKAVPLIIIGAGTGGLLMAKKMSHRLLPSQVLLIDPSPVHYFQPHWSLAGAGLVKSKNTKRPIEKLIPKGIQWLKTTVVKIDPHLNRITTSDKGEWSYNQLIIACGTESHWESIQGLGGHLGTQGLCSTYYYDGLEYTRNMIKKFKGGTALFTMPALPFKCPGAPQKIMYLADQIFRENGVRENTEIIFLTDNKSIFNVKESLPVLQEVIRRKQITLRLEHQLISVDPNKKIACFNHHVPVPLIDGKSTHKEVPTEIKYDLLHIVPPQSAPGFLANLCRNGWLSVDSTTLQHSEYSNIFGIGDVIGVSNSKTASAVRSQAPVVEDNLVSLISKKPLKAKYQGDSICPMETDKKSAILIRLKFGQKHQYSTKERYIYWLFKRYLLPFLYWRMVRPYFWD